MKTALLKFIMKFWSFTVVFGLLGAVFPIILGSISHYYYSNPDNQWFISASEQSIFEKIIIVLWPSSIIGLAEAPGNEKIIQIYSLAGNVLLYIFVGAFVWLGLNKHKAFFAIPALVLIPIWCFLLSSMYR